MKLNHINVDCKIGTGQRAKTQVREVPILSDLRIFQEPGWLCACAYKFCKMLRVTRIKFLSGSSKKKTIIKLLHVEEYSTDPVPSFQQLRDVLHQL